MLLLLSELGEVKVVASDSSPVIYGGTNLHIHMFCVCVCVERDFM